MNKEISLKIKQIQFLLCVLIVIMHSMNISYHGILKADWQALFEYALGGGICQFAVPIFYFLSAYLFYWNCDGKNTILKKIKARVHTLIIPYFIWNTVWEIYYILLYKAGFSEKDFSGYKPLNYIADVLTSANTALWFVKWLIIFSVLAPVIYYILKHKKLFWTIEIIVSIALLLFKIDYFTPFYWIPIYFMGGYLGIHTDAVEAKQKECEKKSNSIAIGICLAIIAIVIVITMIYYNWWTYLLVRYVGAGAFLVLFFLLPQVDCEFKMMDYSYPIYCIHVPICGMIKHFINGIIGFMITPVITIGLIVIFAEALIRFMPDSYYILFGKREK